MPTGKDKGKTLSHDDRRTLELLEDAQRQYERYRELHDIATVVDSSQESLEPPVPNWHSPLTLVLRS